MMAEKTAIGNGPFHVTVKSDGQALDCTAHIHSIRVESFFNRIATATITLNEKGTEGKGYEIADSKVLVPGKKISVSVGYEDKDETDIFSGVIVRMASKLSSGTSELIITAKHEAFRLTRTRKVSRFSDALDSDIVSDIISAYGISAEIEATDIQHESMVQYNATDWDFINLRTEACGQILRTTPEGIVSGIPDISSDAVLRITSSMSIMEFEAEMDGASSYDNFISEAWNYTSSEQETETIASGEFDMDQGDLGSPDLSGDLESGDYLVPLASVQSESTAMSAWVKAAMMRKGLSRITGKVIIPGNADVKLADLISLDNVGNRFSGKTIVSGIIQDISGTSWTTELSFGVEDRTFAERYDDINLKPASGALPVVNGLQIAIVDKISEDPLGQNRILIHLTSGEETQLWARVSLLDAGESRGFHFMPEVGDEVIVGFINDNPNMPVVLGMLHSSDRPDPVEADDDNLVKGIYTREKIKLEFDEDKKSVLIETPGGNKILISDDQKGIALEDQNGNKLTMNDQGVSIQSAKALSIEANQDISIKGANVTLEANASFKATGNSGAELSTSAIATLKGSLVQIN